MSLARTRLPGTPSRCPCMSSFLSPRPAAWWPMPGLSRYSLRFRARTPARRPSPPPRSCGRCPKSRCRCCAAYPCGSRCTSLRHAPPCSWPECCCLRRGLPPLGRSFSDPRRGLPPLGRSFPDPRRGRISPSPATGSPPRGYCRRKPWCSFPRNGCSAPWPACSCLPRGSAAP